MADYDHDIKEDLGYFLSVVPDEDDREKDDDEEFEEDEDDEDIEGSDLDEDDDGEDPKPSQSAVQPLDLR
jgi:hypothetical protein